uniref:Uncharacterized protein n=1 Tax=Sciurus vulgaris TaxID=55149 RepID=A0A8D2DM84_SCIVU
QLSSLSLTPSQSVVTTVPLTSSMKSIFVQPKLPLLKILQAAGAQGEMFTVKEVMHYLGQYIMVNHLTTCFHCARRLKKAGASCPICKKEIQLTLSLILFPVLLLCNVILVSESKVVIQKIVRLRK